MNQYAKILLTIILCDIAITSLGASFLEKEYIIMFELNPLMLWLLLHSILLFASVKLLLGCVCIKLIAISSHRNMIYKYISIAYILILVSTSIITLPK